MSMSGFRNMSKIFFFFFVGGGGGVGWGGGEERGNNMAFLYHMVWLDRGFYLITHRGVVREITPVRPMWYIWYYLLSSYGIRSMSSHWRIFFYSKKKKKKKKKKVIAWLIAGTWWGIRNWIVVRGTKMADGK